jgi:hypothetical protein
MRKEMERRLTHKNTTTNERRVSALHLEDAV